MPYSVSLNKDDGFINVRVSSNATHEEHCAAYDEALRLCQENMCSKILVDLRELDTCQSSKVECFLFGEWVAGSSKCLRIAHVMPTNKKSKEDVEFTATVEENRGVITGIFGTVDKAKKWLMTQ